MSKRANNRFTTPDIIDPPGKVCLIMEIPDNEIHISNLFGALWELAQGNSWADDEAHTAKDLAIVWKRYLANLKIVDNCMNEKWTVRLNPDDCTEVQQFDNEIMDYADVFSLRCAVDTVIGEQFPPNNPPGTSQPGPQPGGGNPQPAQCFELKLQVGGYAATLIPINIQSGWSVTVLEVSGATTDGFLAQFPPYISLWRCGDGNLYQLGSCFGSPELITTDPLPASNHLIPLIQYPDATYAPIVQGETFLVPTGQPDGFYQLLINNSPGSGTNPGQPAGQLTVKLKLCNSGWCYDFLASNQLGTTALAYPYPFGGAVATWDGTRWNGTTSGQAWCYVYVNIPSGTTVSDIVSDGSPDLVIEVFEGADLSGAFCVAGAEGQRHLTGTFVGPCSIVVADNTHFGAYVTRIQVAGPTVTNPFGTNNC